MEKVLITCRWGCVKGLELSRDNVGSRGVGGSPGKWERDACKLSHNMWPKECCGVPCQCSLRINICFNSGPSTNIIYFDRMYLGRVMECATAAGEETD